MTTRRVCLISLGAYPLLAESDHLTQGGAEIQFVLLGKNLRARGFDVHFIVKDTNHNQCEMLGNISIHKLSFNYMNGKKFFLLNDWMDFFICLFAIDADYYFIKTPRHLLFPLAIFTQFSKKKVIFVGQIDEDVLSDNVKKKDGLIGYLFYRIGIRQAFFTVSQNIKQMKGFIFNFKKRSVLIKNYLSLNTEFSSTPKNYILWVGNNHSKKHPEIFLRLVKDFPEFKFVMIMSTTAQNPTDRTIKQIADKLPNLDYKGFIPFSSIAKYFEEAVLFIGTSDMEGFPNTYIQAWQTKTPVISLHIDPDFVIQRFMLGRLSGSYEKLCHDLQMLMNDAQLRFAIGENCKRYVDNHHHELKVTERFLDFIEYSERFI
jgi:glycosyltransferase involved in cell wall biosynthesis